MLKAILIGAAAIGLGVAALAVHFGIILRPRPAAAQAVTHATTTFPRTDAGCARLYGGTERVSTAGAGDPYKYVDCKIARCHRVYAADALQFNACVGVVGLDVDPHARERQSATGASSASSAGSPQSAPPASKATAQVQAVELARGMAAGLTSSGARGAACEAVNLAPIKVACGFQNANGTAERVGATVTMVSPSRARVTLKSSTVASYCIDSTSGSSKRKQAGLSSAVASSTCP
jgi:hypothetical protein